ncbi:MAG: GNAT family N-acetyltransferase [Bacteroidota bacterium]
MSVELNVVPTTEKPTLQSLLSDYLKELNAELDYPYFDLYWKEENRIPLFIKVKDATIGFALLNRWFEHPVFEADRAIAEFYILPDSRRRGYGQAAAQQIFATFGKHWEVKTGMDNEMAIAFWRTAIGTFTNDAFSEWRKETEGVVIWTF